jgi:hypothetical protein
LKNPPDSFLKRSGGFFIYRIRLTNFSPFSKSFKLLRKRFTCASFSLLKLPPICGVMKQFGNCQRGSSGGSGSGSVTSKYAPAILPDLSPAAKAFWSMVEPRPML